MNDERIRQIAEAAATKAVVHHYVNAAVQAVARQAVADERFYARQMRRAHEYAQLLLARGRRGEDAVKASALWVGAPDGLKVIRRLDGDDKYSDKGQVPSNQKQR